MNVVDVRKYFLKCPIDSVTSYRVQAKLVFPDCIQIRMEKSTHHIHSELLYKNDIKFLCFI